MTYTLEPALPPTATPKDYERIHFDTANVPNKRIVGLLACQRDPLLRHLRTKVHAAREAAIAAPPAPKGKGNMKKGPKSGTSTPKVEENGEKEKGKLWEVELEDTVIFPEGGGQPSDTGIIHLLDPNGGKTQSFPVEMCLRRLLDSVHLVRIPPGVEVEGGWEGREVEVEVDWARRLDQMSMHTSQHLLSAIADAKFGLPTLSWSMHPYPSLEPGYVELPRALTLDEAIELEQLCQKAIYEDKKIWVDFTLQGDDGEGGKAREFREIPKDYTGGVIRHINITDTDRNACCGTQHTSLSILSVMHVVPPVGLSSPKATPTRLLFLSGPRAIASLQQASRAHSAAAKIMGFARTDLVERLERSEAQKKETVESLKGLRAEVAKLVGDAAIQAGKEKKGVMLLEREEKATHDFEWMGVVVGSYQEALMATKPANPPLIVMTSTLPNASAGSQTLLLVLSTDNDLAKSVNEDVKKALEGRVKGGGAKGRYMSKIEGKWGKLEKAAVENIVELIKKSRE
ncbi:hypothetical protein IAT38_004690 [Cryptococcus sp. DSM 104549]